MSSVACLPSTFGTLCVEVVTFIFMSEDIFMPIIGLIAKYWMVMVYKIDQLSHCHLKSFYFGANYGKT